MKDYIGLPGQGVPCFQVEIDGGPETREYAFDLSKRASGTQFPM